MPTSYQLFYERHLPHYQPPGTTLFITFRLAGSLPLTVLRQLKGIAEWETAIARQCDPANQPEAFYLAQKRLFDAWDTALADESLESDHLAKPEVAKMIADSLHYRDQREFVLEAFCIMPNHVHLCITPLSDDSGKVLAISKIMKSLKGYTAYQSNLLLGLKGQFWQHESYDHVVRDEKEMARIITYIQQNPIKAGLVSNSSKWPWTFCRANC